MMPCRKFCAFYKVPGRRIYGHRELGQTACPGKHLFPQVQPHSQQDFVSPRETKNCSGPRLARRAAGR